MREEIKKIKNPRVYKGLKEKQDYSQSSSASTKWANKEF